MFCADLMWKRDSLFIPDLNGEGKRLTLTRPACAIQIIATEDRAKLGSLVSLAAGTEVVICGGGYDHRTVKVRAQEGYYFVFSEDLGLPEGLNF